MKHNARESKETIARMLAAGTIRWLDANGAEVSTPVPKNATDDRFPRHAAVYEVLLLKFGPSHGFEIGLNHDGARLRMRHNGLPTLNGGATTLANLLALPVSAFDTREAMEDANRDAHTRRRVKRAAHRNSRAYRRMWRDESGR